MFFSKSAAHALFMPCLVAPLLCIFVFIHAWRSCCLLPHDAPTGDVRLQLFGQLALPVIQLAVSTFPFSTILTRP